jgi:hypothetical protein
LEQIPKHSGSNRRRRPNNSNLRRPFPQERTNYNATRSRIRSQEIGLVATSE